MLSVEHESGFGVVIFLKAYMILHICLILHSAVSPGRSTNPANPRNLNFKSKACFYSLCHPVPSNTLWNQFTPEIRIKAG